MVVLLTNCSSLERMRNDRRAADARRDPESHHPRGLQAGADADAGAAAGDLQPNSLWRTGSRAFFKDQRATQVGDILTVLVKITDRAQFENETQRSRNNKENSGVDDFVGSKALKPAAQPSTCRAAS